MINHKRFELRRRLRSGHSILAALGFFILSSGVVLGGSGSLLMIPTTPQGAKAVANTPRVPHEQAVASAPTIEAKPVAPVLAAPAPTQAPAWQVVGSESVPYAEVGARAGLVINDATGDILAAKNIHQKMPMASITKLMTAWVALDRAGMDQEITISHKAANTPPTHMPLLEGEKLTLRELLYATLLTSANDAAQAIADGLGGEGDFVQGMNTKAELIGMTNTSFGNPTGFDVPGHGSTAVDVAKMTHELFAAHPELRDMLQQPEVSLPATSTHKAYYVANFHPLVSNYPGFQGGKPGFTGEAGNCLVTMAERNGKKVIAVVLNSPNSATESTQLLDYGFNQL